MLDVAKSHLNPDLLKLAWSCGYVLLFHYGHTTGVAQVNDTDLHGAFEREYLEVEQRFFNWQQEDSPGTITRRPQDVVDDCCQTWIAAQHTHDRWGHKSVGLTIALGGSEDRLISREARHCWNELHMCAVRQKPSMR